MARTLTLILSLILIGSAFGQQAIVPHRRANFRVVPAAGGGGGSVQHDGEANVTNGTIGTTLTLTGKTTAGANRCGVVHVSWFNDADSITSVTWNGVGMTLGTNAFEITGWSLGTALYWIVNPPTGASSIVITFGSSASITACASSYNNVDQTTPISNRANMATVGAVVGPLSLTCASVSGEMVVDSWCVDDNNPPYTVGTGQTQMMNDVTGIDGYGLCSREASTGTSVPMTWTFPSGSAHRCGGAMSLKAAP